MCGRGQHRIPGIESRISVIGLMATVHLLITPSVVWSQTLNLSEVTTEPPTILSLPAALALKAAAAATAAVSPSTPSRGVQLSADYDYVESPPGGPAATAQSQPLTAASTPRPPQSPDYGGLFYPLYGDPSPAEGRPAGSQAVPLPPMTQLPERPGGFAAPPVNAMGGQGWGERGEQTEWLRERLKQLRKFQGNSPAALTQLQVLQKQFPGVNVTQIYNSYGMYGDDGFRGYLQQRAYGEGYAQSYNGGYGEGYGEDWYYYNGTWYPNYEFEDWYYHNGTWHPSMGDWEDGYFHNGTWYPGLDEMDEWYYHNGTWYPSLGDWEDGYFHNGTWYPGLEDMMEDGYFYNGTWYPGYGDLEDGYYYNGTWYPGYETEGVYEREEPEREDLMWWQLHHPRWSGQDTSWYSSGIQQRPPYVQVPPLTLPNAGRPAPQWSPTPKLTLLQQLRSKTPSQSTGEQVQRQSDANPLASVYRNRQAQNSEQKLPVRQRQPIPGRPLALPVVQQPSGQGKRQQFQARPPPPGYVPRGRRRGTTNQGGRPKAARLSGQPGGRLPPPPPRPPFSRIPPPHWKPNAPGHPGNKLSSPGPGSSQARDEGPTVKFRPSSPLDPYRSTATVTMGIAIACLIGLALIIAPLLCLLHKYRQEKRVKKRTFLRRAEHGSIDEGIMDAMVMSELGERKGSRVTKIGAKGGKSVWKGARPKTGRASRADFPELQPLETISSSDRELRDLYSTIP
ncbi:Pneumococcal surface protein C [Elysia marginata]|uniref:Pneumococcal surface protein C n=1 Tax=Elysia marginata TaxID=1093978 RepID=A0AAV4JXC2_9GAST|nr:Pneumococcal surface protein C [Elysia marginata]